MKQQDFEKHFRPDWELLSSLTEGANNSEEMERLPDLYRKACHHLALAKERHYSRYLIRMLNTITLNAHQYLYRRSALKHFRLFRFVVFTFPATLRKNYRFILIASLLFILPGMIMGGLCYKNDEIIYSVMSYGQVQGLEKMYAPGARVLGRERTSESDIAMFGFYIKNNIGISFRTFAGGMLFGVGSVFFIIYNGIILGAVAGHMSRVGYVDTFYPFVIGHGAFELTAIVLSGAAGLILGYALLSPGSYSRRDALRIAGKEAVIIIYGAALMLLFAAFIEAFWSSSTHLAVNIKYIVGAVLWVAVPCFCMFAGRNN